MPGVLKRLLNVAIAADEGVNAAFGGSPKHTISGTVGRASAKGAAWARYFAEPLVDFLFGKGHCQRAAKAEANY